eukprot:jgi/Ulvmu1/8873/UM049_0055.1
MQLARIQRLSRSCAAVGALRAVPHADRIVRRNVTANAGGKVVSTEAAPAALGPYSQAVKAGSTLYISGQLGLEPSTMDFAGESVEHQTTQVMANLKAILEADGGSFENVVKTTVLLADMGDFAAVNEIYAKAFEGMEPPARACFAVKTLPKNALVEIEAIATIP